MCYPRIVRKDGIKKRRFKSYKAMHTSSLKRKRLKADKDRQTATTTDSATETDMESGSEDASGSSSGVEDDGQEGRTGNGTNHSQLQTTTDTTEDKGSDEDVTVDGGEGMLMLMPAMCTATRSSQDQCGIAADNTFRGRPPWTPAVYPRRT